MSVTGRSPVERAVFLLHDVFGYGYDEVAAIVGKSADNCRQLALRARRHVTEGKPRFETSRVRREELAARFFAAVGGGDIDGLVGLLAEDAVVYGDSGGARPSWPRPIAGRDHVGRLLGGLIRSVINPHKLRHLGPLAKTGDLRRQLHG